MTISTIKTLVWQVLSPSCPPAAAVTAGAVPPLNGGHNVVSSATFQAGGAEWNYSNETVDRLECTGPLSTGVDIQVNYWDAICINYINWCIQVCNRNMHHAVHVYSEYTYNMYIGAEVSWGIQYISLHLPIVQTKAQANTHHFVYHHSTALHSAALHTAAHYYARHLSRYICQVLIAHSFIFHTLTVAATLTHSTCTAGALMHSLHPCRSLPKQTFFL